MKIPKEQILPLIESHMLPKNPEQSWIFDNLVFLHIGGSQLYGTANEDSDLDLIGITVPPKSYWIGARKFESRREKIPEINADVIIYDIRRWINLAVAMNPNVIETLFVTSYNPCAVIWSSFCGKKKR